MFKGRYILTLTFLFPICTVLKRIVKSQKLKIWMQTCHKCAIWVIYLKLWAYHRYYIQYMVVTGWKITVSKENAVWCWRFLHQEKKTKQPNFFPFSKHVFSHSGYNVYHVFSPVCGMIVTCNATQWKISLHRHICSPTQKHHVWLSEGNKTKHAVSSGFKWEFSS